MPRGVNMRRSEVQGIRLKTKFPGFDHRLFGLFVQFVCLSVCLFVRLFVCLFVWLVGWLLFVYLCICVCIRVFPFSVVLLCTRSLVCSFACSFICVCVCVMQFPFVLFVLPLFVLLVMLCSVLFNSILFPFLFWHGFVLCYCAACCLRFCGVGVAVCLVCCAVCCFVLFCFLCVTCG